MEQPQLMQRLREVCNDADAVLQGRIVAARDWYQVEIKIKNIPCKTSSRLRQLMNLAEDGTYVLYSQGEGASVTEAIAEAAGRALSMLAALKVCESHC